MRTLEAMDLGPKLTVLSARDWERRPRDLRRRPYMQQLARGAWVRSAEPLSVQQRSVLLRDHLERHDGQLTLTGLTALGRRSMNEVVALLDQLPPRAQSVVRVRQALALAQGPTISAMETLLRLVVLRCGLPPMETNHPVLMDGKYVYPDLAWPVEMVALEYNGRPHWEDGRAYGDENYRIQRLRDHGWRVRVVVLDDLRDPKRRRELLQWLFHHLDPARAKRQQSLQQHMRGR